MGTKIQIYLHYWILKPIPPSFIKSLGLKRKNSVSYELANNTGDIYKLRKYSHGCLLELYFWDDSGINGNSMAGSMINWGFTKPTKSGHNSGTLIKWF